MKYAFQISAIVLLIISFIIDRRKSINALRIALKRFISILPTFIIVIVMTSFVFGFLSESLIQKAIGAASNRWIATGIASVVGSIAIMPGFIAFPLGAILKSNGIPYMVISAFTTTLMMVGFLTFPIEQAFLGSRVAIVRNAIGFAIALIVAIITGIVFGEVFN